MIIYGPSDWNYADKAPDYRKMTGEFRVRNAELFISEQKKSVTSTKEFEDILQEFQQGYYPDDEDLEKYYIGAKKCLTLQEAANYLGLQRSVLYKMTSDKTIRFFKPNGKMIYFEKDVLDDWVRQNPTNPINNEDYDRK